MTLYEEMMHLLDRTQVPYAVLARELGLTRHWLYRVANGKIEDPGVKKAEALLTLLKEYEDE